MKNPSNKAMAEAYFRWYYDMGVWKDLHYRGVRTLKCPTDMWNYQEIICSRGIGWVIETGTCHGGSALFFADLLQNQGAQGSVISVDVSHAELQVKSHPRIHFLLGDSASPEIVATVTGLLPQDRAPVFMILDSNHAMAHVLRELDTWVPLLRSGDYLVVEDTCVNGHPVRPGFGPGPWEAVEQYLAHNPGKLLHDAAREAKFGFTAAPHGFFVKREPEGRKIAT